MVHYEEPQPGLMTLPLLDEKEAGGVLAEIQALENWAPATVRGKKKANLNTSVRSAEAAALPASSLSLSLFEARIKSAIRPLIYQRWKRDIIRHSPVQLVRYFPGGFYNMHRDCGYNFNDRYFTTVCYLNADFEGGGTYFPDSDFTVIPEVGKAVIFPSDYLHRANIVNEGAKYIAVIWMLDNPPVSWM